MMTGKVTLRMNAIVTYRVSDARTAVSVVDDVRQALYREAQLALRAVVGARELDAFLMEKDGVACELRMRFCEGFSAGKSNPNRDA
jgi:regulator of protease activity HflC (stomatin/prohibitin superfamily)